MILYHKLRIENGKRGGKMRKRWEKELKIGNG